MPMFNPPHPGETLIDGMKPIWTNDYGYEVDDGGWSASNGRDGIPKASPGGALFTGNETAGSMANNSLTRWYDDGAPAPAAPDGPGALR